MSKSLKVSIIVPVYNVKDYLDECICSLLSQDIDNYEIILVNDGSTDGSDLICQQYQKAHAKIKYLSQENKGQSVARNYGFRVAEGEYILFVDSDDYIQKETCRTMYEAAKKNGADIVVGDILNEKEKVETDKSFRCCPAEFGCVTTLEYTRYAINNGMYDIVPWIRLVRKAYLESNNIHFLEGCYYEDQEYTMKLFTSACGKVIKLRFPFYYYRMDRIGSTTNYASKKKGKDFLEVITYMQKEVVWDNSETTEVQCKIIGLAYYHFIDLWLRIQHQYQSELFKQFLVIAKSWTGYQKVIDLMADDIKRKIIKFTTHNLLLKVEFFIRKLIKSIIKR